MHLYVNLIYGLKQSTTNGFSQMIKYLMDYKFIAQWLFLKLSLLKTEMDNDFIQHFISFIQPGTEPIM
jgi:hypothetical protein